MSVHARSAVAMPLSSPVDDFRAAITAAGIAPPDVIVTDGRLHRFASNDKHGDDAGWYVLYDDDFPAGAFGDWRSGLSETWRADIGRKLSPSEQAAHRKRMDAIRREREAEEARRRAEARERATAIWQAASPAPADHPYLHAKGVRSHGLRAHEGALVIPVRDGAELHSLQFIDADSAKRFLSGGRVKGCYHAIGKPDGVLIVAEGYATGASVHEATGHAVAVAFSAGNLRFVAEALRAKLPDARIIIAGDNDESGTGQRAAREAAQAVGGFVAVPAEPGDWNDVHRTYGAEAVRAGIEAAQPPAVSDEAPAVSATDAAATVQAAIARAKDDAGAPFEVGALAAWRTIRRDDPAAYVRCRTAAKAAGVPLGELDRVLRDAPEVEATGVALVEPDPEPWPEPVDGADLLDAFADRMRQHVRMPQPAVTVCAVWALMTWVYDSLDVLPLLVIRSPERGCGKTTLIDALSRLVARALPASGITASALFRTIEAAQPTLLIDEADTFARDNEELRGIINSGHTRTSARVIRCVGEDFEPRAFSTWCPKVLAGIGRLPGTIEDRAFIVELQRLAPGEKVERLRNSDQWPDLRRQAARWAADHGDLAPAVPFDYLGNRTADNWCALATVTQATSGDWPARIEAAAKHYAGQADDGGSVGVELLRDVRAVFDAAGADRLPSADLVDRLTADPTGRWAEYRHGKPLTQRQLARLLESFAVRPKQAVRIGGKTPKGYMREQFVDAWSRYLPLAGGSPRATGQQSTSGAASSRCPLQDPKGNVADRESEGQHRKRSNDADCCPVADRDPPYGETDRSIAANERERSGRPAAWRADV